MTSLETAFNTTTHFAFCCLFISPLKGTPTFLKHFWMGKILFVWFYG